MSVWMCVSMQSDNALAMCSVQKDQDLKHRAEQFSSQQAGAYLQAAQRSRAKAAIWSWYS